MRNIVLLALAATLAGCATGPSRSEALASLVGRPESDALRILGAPNHVLDANGHHFLAYEDTGINYVTGSPYGFGYYAPISVPIVRICTTTLEITDGRVSSWTLRGACG